MPTSPKPTRRGLLAGFAASASALVLSGCKQLDAAGQSSWFRDNVLHIGEDLNRTVQRFFLHPTSLAREFPESEISPKFKANGSTDPDDPAYRALAANGFVDWKLKVGGLVETPMEFSLADLRAMPARTQITRHDCVEGWSCIGEWTGAKLAPIMAMTGLKPQAKHLVLYCADSLDAAAPPGQQQYYETLDLADIFHPQTILAYAMNGAPLSVAHGAPLRLRAERHLGYKQAKYVMRLEAVEDFSHISRGNGGFWEDRGYEWYAGR